MPFVICRKFETDVSETIAETQQPKPEKAEVSLSAPEFVITVSDLKVKEGEAATLTCKATGYPVPEVTWYHANKPIQSDDVYRVVPGEAGESTLEIPESFPEDGGVYTVKATNEAGSVEATAILTVTG